MRPSPLRARGPHPNPTTGGVRWDSGTPAPVLAPSVRGRQPVNANAEETTVPTARPRPGPARLVLVRHAESLGNVADRDARERGDSRLDLHVRDADVALSPTGEAQASAVGRYVATLPADEQPTVVLQACAVRARRRHRRARPVRDGRAAPG